MSKCLDLSRLPKAPGLRSINHHNVTPGSPLPLLFPGIAPYKPSRAVDPKHPATRWKSYLFPHFSCPAFTLRAVPKGALLRHEFERRSSPVKRSAMVPGGKNGSKRLDMSILFMIAKQKTNKRAVVRNKIAMRIRSSFELIVTRGADAEPKDNVEGRQVGKECAPEESSSVVRKPKGKPDRSGRELQLASLASSITPSNSGLVSNPASTEHLILQDWTYVMSPSLLVYRMPLPDLIRNLRAGLQSIREQSIKLNELWGLAKTPTIKLPLANITSEETEVDWRHIATDENDIPVSFDLDEPEHDPTKAGKSINPQKQSIKLFFPKSTSPPPGESSSALVGDDQLVTSPRSVGMPTRLASPANRPDRQSSDSMSDHSNTTIPDHSNATIPALSTFRIGAMERLAVMRNRPLVVPGCKAEQRHS